MFLLIVFLICVFITLAVGVLAGVSDIKTMTIPNNYSLYVIATFVVAYLALYMGGQGDVFSTLISHLISAALMFVVTFVLFAIKIIGAGDSKYGTACALWVGVQYLPVLLFFMAVTGGLLGGVALFVKRKKPFKSPLAGGWIEQVQSGKDKVPYGIAISFGMFIAFIYAGYFSPENLSSFVASTNDGGGS